MLKCTCLNREVKVWNEREVFKQFLSNIYLLPIKFMEHKDSFLNAIICIFGIAYSIARMQAEHFFFLASFLLT